MKFHLWDTLVPVSNFRFHKVWHEMYVFWFQAFRKQELHLQSYKRFSGWVSRVSWLCGVTAQGVESFRKQTGKRQQLVAHYSLQAFLGMPTGHGWELCERAQVMQRLSLSHSSQNWVFWWNLSIKIGWIMYMKCICWMMNRCIIEHPRVWLEFCTVVLHAHKTGVNNLFCFEWNVCLTS